MAAILPVFIVLSVVVCSAICKLCPDRNVSDILEFTTKTNAQDFVGSGESYQLACCATGFRNKVTWLRYQKYPAPPKWVPFPPLNSGIHQQPFTTEDGQVLVLLRAGNQYATNFTCVAANQTAQINKTTELFVINCDTLHGAPLVIAEPRNRDVSAGSDVTFSCGGYFGCYNMADRRVDWMMQRNISEGFVPLQNYNDRYSVNVTKRDNWTKIIADFTIRNVQEEDFGVNFTCILASLSNTTSRIVRLRRIVPPEAVDTTSEAAISVGSTFGGLLLLFLSCLLVYGMWGPQIKFFVKKRAGCLLKPIGKRFDYDVALVSAEDDQSVAMEIEMELRNRGYRVFGPSDVIPGSPVGEAMRSVSISAVHAFLHSEHTRMDTMVNFLFGLVATTVDWDNLHIVVIYLDNSHKVNSDVSWDNAVERFHHEDEDAAFYIDEAGGNRAMLPTDNRISSPIPYKVWNKFKSVEWPKADCSQRQRNNFYSCLQSYLPKIDPPVD